MTGSALYLGTIRHRRLAGPRHDFAYPVWHLLLDLDELDDLVATIPFLSHNRMNLLSIDDRDHFGPGAGSIRTKLGEWLAARGVELGARRVRLLTGARLLGHSFDPVRFYFCDGPDARIREVVAEVRSTFGEGYGYLLPATGGSVVRAETDKRFHVSPFLEDHGVYRFRVAEPGERLTIHIDLLQQESRVFDATLSSARRPLTAKGLAGALTRWSGSGMRTLARIHWQALRLWLRGAKVVPKPAPSAGTWRTRHG